MFFRLLNKTYLKFQNSCDPEKKLLLLNHNAHNLNIAGRKTFVFVLYTFYCFERQNIIAKFQSVTAVDLILFFNDIKVSKLRNILDSLFTNSTSQRKLGVTFKLPNRTTAVLRKQYSILTNQTINMTAKITHQMLHY